MRGLPVGLQPGCLSRRPSAISQLVHGDPAGGQHAAGVGHRHGARRAAAAPARHSARALTCNNTNVVIPYIDIVNEVLEAAIAAAAIARPTVVETTGTTAERRALPQQT